MLTPFEICSERIKSDVSLAATRFKIRSSISTNVTSTPNFRAVAAASNPIYPPPTINKRIPLFINAPIEFASFKSRMVNRFLTLPPI